MINLMISTTWCIDDYEHNFWYFNEPFIMHSNESYFDFSSIPSLGKQKSLSYFSSEKDKITAFNKQIGNLS